MIGELSRLKSRWWSTNSNRWWQTVWLHVNLLIGGQRIIRSVAADGEEVALQRLAAIVDQGSDGLCKGHDWRPQARNARPIAVRGASCWRIELETAQAKIGLHWRTTCGGRRCQPLLSVTQWSRELTLSLRASPMLHNA